MTPMNLSTDLCKFTKSIEIYW